MKNTIIGCVAVCLLSFGCASQGESDELETEVSDAAEAAASVTLASVELSPTHLVKFVHYPEVGVVGVSESLNYDSDGVQNSISVPLDGGVTISELYVRLAKQVDWKVADLLQELETDLEAAPADAGSADESPAAAVEAGESNDSDVGPVGSERTAQTSQALCAEPTWNWTADDTWFRQTHCDSTYQYCRSRQSSHSRTAKSRYNKSVFFSQSHCSGAWYGLKFRRATECSWLGVCAIETDLLTQGNLEPRKLMSTYWYVNGKDADGEWPAWTAEIFSHSGNSTGLGFKSWN